jgi:nicotinate-nucleotide adenylyltransferase
MKLGLMGGTFNPIHIGHLEIASKVLDIFNLKKVIFILSGNPPHKNRGEIVDASHRLKMIKLAISEGVRYSDSSESSDSNYKRFEVSDIEIKRKGKSYTLDTIKQIREIHSISTRNRKTGGDTDIYFIAGADSALDLPNWKDPLKILSLSHFVVVERPHFSLKGLDEKYRKRIITVEGIFVDISSSDIRKRIREGKPIKSLVPKDVEKYIRKNKLYI